jgi:transposase
MHPSSRHRTSSVPGARQQLLDRIATLQAHVADLEQQLADRDARIAALEEELRRRGKSYRPRPRVLPQAKHRHDRRRRRYRRHPGVFRPEPRPDEHTIHHDVHPQRCPRCGSCDLEPTGAYEDHYVEDIPEPKIELHRYRRHIYRCQSCQKACQGRGDQELPGAHIGQRARLLTCYARAHLGISLGKTQALLRDFFGLAASRAGLLGHLRWGSELCAPVVQELWAILRASPVVHADETGWRIDGKNVWAWCFSDPRLALFLIDRHRSRAVIERALGKSFAGTLVSDFYAAYNRLGCRQQRCLVHLLRDLHELRQELHPHSVRAFVQPLIEVFQDALQLAKDREKLSPQAFAGARQRLNGRLDQLILETHSRDPDCLRIRRRIFWHCDELFVFLDDPQVPADNNLVERDIRSLAAARSDGGTNRSTWGATSFANLKSVIRTCQKAGRSFFAYGVALVRATLAGTPLPLPLDSS